MTGIVSRSYFACAMAFLGALIFGLTGTLMPVAAQTFPVKPLRLIVPCPAGSAADVGNAVAQMKSGKLKGLGVTMLRRTVLAPELPTVAEAGAMPGFAIVPWVGLLAPVNIPRAAREGLRTAAATALNRAAIKAQLTAIGLGPDPQDGAGLARTIEADIKLWARVLAEAGVQPE